MRLQSGKIGQETSFKYLKRICEIPAHNLLFATTININQIQIILNATTK